jgi:hypothetical protein
MELHRRSLLTGLVSALVAIPVAAKLEPVQALVSNPDFDMIRTRALMAKVQNAILRTTRHHIADFNDVETRESVRKMIKYYSKSLVDSGQISNMMIVCDETNNTPEVIDDYGLKVDVRFYVGHTDHLVSCNSHLVSRGIHFSEIIH